MRAPVHMHSAFHRSIRFQDNSGAEDCYAARKCKEAL